jgi:arsenate reductase
VTLYHNPKCSTSRKAVDLLQDKGIDAEVVEYLKAGVAAGMDRST